MIKKNLINEIFHILYRIKSMSAPTLEKINLMRPSVNGSHPPVNGY